MKNTQKRLPVFAMWMIGNEHHVKEIGTAASYNEAREAATAAKLAVLKVTRRASMRDRGPPRYIVNVV